jgi:outer membrane biosynthesis protein TonB
VARALEGAAPTVLYPSAPVVPTVVEKPASKTGVWIVAGVAAMALAIGGTWYATQPKPQEPVAKSEPAPVQKQPELKQPEPPPETKQKKTDPPPAKPAAKEVKQEAVKPREPEPEPPKPPPVNHAALGDAARNAGDFRTALRHYREANDAAKLAAVQRAIEGDTEERASSSMDRGQFAEAQRAVDGWLKEFPDSQRLQRLRARIIKARDSQ